MRQAFPYNVEVSGKYGAPMGRHNVGGPDDSKLRLNLRRVPLYDGAYDKGGAYWGSPSDLWCAWTSDRSVIRYFRAPGRYSAIKELREDFPNAVIPQ